MRIQLYIISIYLSMPDCFYQIFVCIQICINMLGVAPFPVTVANEGLYESPTKHVNHPGGPRYWKGTTPRRLSPFSSLSVTTLQVVVNQSGKNKEVCLLQLSSSTSRHAIFCFVGRIPPNLAEDVCQTFGGWNHSGKIEISDRLS